MNFPGVYRLPSEALYDWLTGFFLNTETCQNDSVFGQICIDVSLKYFKTKEESIIINFKSEIANFT